MSLSIQIVASSCQFPLGFLSVDPVLKARVDRLQARYMSISGLEDVIHQTTDLFTRAINIVDHTHNVTGVESLQTLPVEVATILASSLPAELLLDALDLLHSSVIVVTDHTIA